jgi:hypothetical protein
MTAILVKLIISVRGRHYDYSSRGAKIPVTSLVPSRQNGGKEKLRLRATNLVQPVTFYSKLCAVKE